MNSTIQRLLLQDLNLVKSPDGKISASGVCQFKYYQAGEYQAGSARFQAFGQAALKLQEAKGAVAIVKGSVDIISPNEERVNHQLIFRISHVLSFESAVSAPVPIPVSAPAISNGHNTSEISLDELPC